MNSTVTDDNKVYTYERPRAELRQMLIDAQQRSAAAGPKVAAPYHYDLHEARASLWECAGWTLFGAVSIGGLAVAISWGLR